MHDQSLCQIHENLFDGVPHPLILEILSYLPILSSVYFISSGKRLWSFKSRLDDIPHITIFKSILRGKEYLLAAIEKASLLNDKELVEFFLQKTEEKYTIDLLRKRLQGASQGGHTGLVDFFIRKGVPDVNDGLYGAALGGRIDLLNFFINEKKCCKWNLGLQGACLGGHKNLVEMFLAKSAYSRGVSREGIAPASQGGHLEILEMVMVASKYCYIGREIVEAIESAYEQGHKHIIEYLLCSGHTDEISKDFNRAIAQGDHTSLAKLLQSSRRVATEEALISTAIQGYTKVMEILSKGFHHSFSTLDECMLKAAKWGHLDYVEYMLQRGADKEKCLEAAITKGPAAFRGQDWSKYFAEKGGGVILMETAVRDNKKDTIGTLISLRNFDWNRFMCSATSWSNRELVDFFIHKGANDWNAAMCQAIRYKYFDLMEYFIEKGADHWNRAMCASARIGDMELTERFIQNGGNNWEEAIKEANSQVNKEMVRYLKARTKEIKANSRKAKYEKKK